MHLKGFDEVTRHLLKTGPHIRNISTVTLDEDATFIPTGVKGTLFNYNAERAFEAFTTYCPEYDMVIRNTATVTSTPVTVNLKIYRRH